ncbi:GIY-YIG nuclease family protein [Trichlorobacter lovleyi]|uniref:Excinuclease ABC C subunit domain protein n=1 Tax=Trichlorobacter lovleyi (strain ATCC BAA-1151 / DSM 17278 / SZ) TaxID=398767 RepID=B3E2V7_TRIL1|nr:GIY-YIG nuclease family protein [Trichlorobacter lovleyi]ACD97217.1 Excinuclease ABC C subunit domain protein [Trichlorobacter lovleyi SZ]
MPYMYILECADGSYYTGSTWNLEKRLWEHQQGIGARHTAKRLPVKLLYCEEYARIDEAYFREKQVQGWGRKKKEALMAGKFDELHQLAVCGNETSHLRDAGFDCAQPAEPSRSDSGSRSLSAAEGSNQRSYTPRSLSAAEGSTVIEKDVNE